VKIANTRLALIYYGLLILLLIYVVVVSIVIDKGYLAYDTLSGVNSIKVKGRLALIESLFARLF